MLNLLKQVPAYAYLAVGLVGATATYLFYEPTYSFILSNSSNKNDSLKSRKGKLQLHPRGLINHRNECFINVILQSMASSNKVIEWLVFNKPQSSCLFDTLSKIIALINRLEIAHLNSDSDIDQKPDFSDFNLNQDNLDFYAANHIKKSLNQHNWHIKSSDEHDCHEFFHLLMDVLDDELNELNKSNKSLNFFGSLSAATASTSLRRNRNPFHGYLVSQFECLDCFYKYPLRLESFYSLSLMIPPQRSSSTTTTLFECINNYFKPEHLTEMKCENCSSSSSTIKKRGFIKRQAIAKLPECLCIQIQRNSWSDSNYGMIKQTNYVKFPLNIKIDDNFSQSQYSSIITDSAHHQSTKSSLLFKNVSSTLTTSTTFSLKQVGLGGLLGGNNTTKLSPITRSMDSLSHSSYELRSAVVHYGNAHSGHFVAYRKPLQLGQDDSNWLMISDNDIKSVKETNLLNSNVYMLFYDKQITTI